MHLATDDLPPTNVNVLVCTDCRQYPPQLAHHFADADIVCTNCGLVLARIIDYRPEWPILAVDFNQNPRVGECSLRTAICPSSPEGARLSRLNKLEHTTTAVRDLAVGICSSFELPSFITESTLDIFHEVHKLPQVAGFTRAALISGSFMMACRQAGFPRTFKEVCAVLCVPKYTIGRAYRLIHPVITNNKQPSMAQRLHELLDLVSRHCSHLGLGHAMVLRSHHIARECVRASVFAAHHPATIAAGSVYIASALLQSKVYGPEVADMAGINTSTLGVAVRTIMAAARAGSVRLSHEYSQP